MNLRRLGPLLRLDELRPAIPFRDLALMLGTVIATTVFAGVALPMVAPELAATLGGPQAKAYWYLSRATGFVALGLLWLSMLFGVLITSRMARLWPGGPTAFDLHQFCSLLGMGFVLFHMLILLGDRFIGYSLVDLLLPFRSEAYRPLWVGLGQLGLYLYAIVALSFYVRQLITQRGWRLLHYASFLLFAMAVLHSWFSGSDTGEFAVRVAYWLACVVLLALIVVRVWVADWIRR